MSTVLELKKKKKEGVKIWTGPGREEGSVGRAGGMGSKVWKTAWAKNKSQGEKVPDMSLVQGIEQFGQNRGLMQASTDPLEEWNLYGGGPWPCSEGVCCQGSRSQCKKGVSCVHLTPEGFPGALGWERRLLWSVKPALIRVRDGSGAQRGSSVTHVCHSSPKSWEDLVLEQGPQRAVFQHK